MPGVPTLKWILHRPLARAGYVSALTLLVICSLLNLANAGPASATKKATTSPRQASAAGYWLVGSDGGLFAFGDAGYYGSVPGDHVNVDNIVGMAATADGHGYWLVASDGGLFAFGDAAFYGSMGGHHLSRPVVAMAPTPDGHGYWLVGSDGGLFAFGDAGYYGSVPGDHVNVDNIVGMAATADGHGYWLVASDGGLFAFGDAAFYGSMGGHHLSRPVVAMAPTPDGHGYWLVGSDGGLFAFGDAGYYGSVPGDHVNVDNIVGMAATADGHGYWLVASDGGLFAFGDAAFYGSMGGHHLSRPVVAMAPTPPPPPEPAPTPSIGGQFNAVACPSVSTCIAVGQAGTNDSTGLIEVSTNGGVNFADETVPVDTPPLQAVTCLDTLHCYAVGGTTVDSTEDGGSTWTAANTGVAVTGIACQSVIACVAVGWKGGDTEDLTYWEYTQNGATWSPASGQPLGLNARAACASTFCVGVGESIDTTEDGGKTWGIPPFAGGMQALTDVACLPGSPTTCLAVGPNNSGMAEFLTSSDSGATWVNETSTMPASSGNMQYIACASTTCYGVGPPLTAGGAPILLKTADSGASWSFLAAPTGFFYGNGFPLGGAIGISCADDSTCTLVGAGASGPVVWNASDDGTTWTPGVVS